MGQETGTPVRGLKKPTISKLKKKLLSFLNERHDFVVKTDQSAFQLFALSSSLLSELSFKLEN